MSKKISIRKVLLVSLWAVIGTGMLILLVAAIGKRKSQSCTDYVISIKARQDNFFVDEKDIVKLLKTALQSEIKGTAIAQFDLRKLENLLEENEWSSAAELYFDKQGVLHITVSEREPLARIFTVSGNSFYIDSSARRMSLSQKMTARVPVFTGFPDKTVIRKKDSLLLQDVKHIASFIQQDPFWMAQVSQVEISPQRTFEIIPVVGNHIVRLGNGEELEAKFSRLFIFYKNVLSKTGFDKYPVIDVQYTGQVVAMKKGTVAAAVDSVQLRRNVQRLLEQQELPATVTATAITTTDSIPAERPALSRDTAIRRTGIISANPNPPKPGANARSSSNRVNNQPSRPAAPPRAVMPRRNN
jgi:cell division protein FtsQ